MIVGPTERGNGSKPISTRNLLSRPASGCHSACRTASNDARLYRSVASGTCDTANGCGNAAVGVCGIVNQLISGIRSASEMCAPANTVGAWMISCASVDLTTASAERSSSSMNVPKLASASRMKLGVNMPLLTHRLISALGSPASVACARPAFSTNGLNSACVPIVTVWPSACSARPSASVGCTSPREPIVRITTRIGAGTRSSRCESPRRRSESSCAALHAAITVAAAAGADALRAAVSARWHSCSV